MFKYLMYEELIQTSVIRLGGGWLLWLYRNSHGWFLNKNKMKIFNFECDVRTEKEFSNFQQGFLKLS